MKQLNRCSHLTRGVFICVNLGLLANRLTPQIDVSSQIVGVGISGLAFAKRIEQKAIGLPIRTVNFSVKREERVLETKPIFTGNSAVLIDDIAVSGLTLQFATKNVNPVPISAAVGMLFKSKQTKKRIGIDTVAGIEYSREGGGNPPINSVSTLMEYPDRLAALEQKYFPGYGGALLKILNGENI